MIRVITISREWGAGGETVARILADRLGWRLVDKFLIDQIAKLAKVDPETAGYYDERVDPWFHGLMKTLWVGGYEGVASSVEGEAFDADAMVALLRRVLLDAAGIGQCITVGRGGQCILRDRPNVFHVSLYAPLQDKIERMRHRVPDEAEIAEIAAETDRQRGIFIRRYFDVDWQDRHLYDLMINTHVGLPTVAETILRATALSNDVIAP